MPNTYTMGTCISSKTKFTKLYPVVKAYNIQTGYIFLL